MSKEKKATANVKIEDFIIRNRKIFVCGVAVLVAAAVVVCAVFAISDSNNKKDLAAIDSIEYSYVSKSGGIEEDEISSRQTKAEEALAPYLSKKNVAGVRANMLYADIAFAKKDFTKALDYYLKAANASKKAYTYAECMYNAAVCAEELYKNDDAVAYYKAAADDKDFYLASHALFNAARVLELSGSYSNAAELYQKTVDSYSGYEWANLSESRLIDLKAKGKID